jgi:hypothetical protein
LPARAALATFELAPAIFELARDNSTLASLNFCLRTKHAHQFVLVFAFQSATHYFASSW